MKKNLLTSFIIIALLFLIRPAFLEEKVSLNTVQVFTSLQRTQILKNIAKKFKVKYPNVKIKLISPPYESAYQKVYLMLSTKRPLI